MLAARLASTAWVGWANGGQANALVKAAIMMVVWRIAVESSSSHTIPRSAATAGASPPHFCGKSWAAYETEARANATPPRSPENHMTNM